MRTASSGPRSTCAPTESRLISCGDGIDSSSTDGREYHETPVAFERDRERDERLTVLGYRIVRFTYRRIVRHPAAIAATLRALLG